MRSALIRTLCVAVALLTSTFAQEGKLQFAKLGQCKLQSGQAIQDCTIGYRTYGTLNADRSNAILIPTWFTGTSEGLANATVGPGKILDPSKYFIIAVDALGDGVSSSPSNSKAQPRLQFPEFTIRDMVESEYRLAKEVLKLNHLRAVAGVSMGGMQTFQWAFSHPEFIDMAIPIVGQPRPTPYDELLWRAEMHAVQDDCAYKNGNYTGRPLLRAMADVHRLHLWTPEYDSQNGSYKDYPAASDKVELDESHFDPNDRVRQIQAMLAQDVVPGETLDKAAKQLKVPMTVIVNEHDHMVNPTPAIEFAKAAGAELVVLHGNCGHMSTSCEVNEVVEAVQKALKRK